MGGGEAWGSMAGLWRAAIHRGRNAQFYLSSKTQLIISSVLEKHLRGKARFLFLFLGGKVGI